jgi:hypothetical protein
MTSNNLWPVATCWGAASWWNISAMSASNIGLGVAGDATHEQVTNESDNQQIG